MQAFPPSGRPFDASISPFRTALQAFPGFAVKTPRSNPGVGSRGRTMNPPTMMQMIETAVHPVLPILISRDLIR